MADFRKLSDSVFASPQIAPGDVAAAKELGVTLIINNRPDGEDPASPQGPDIEAAAAEAGIRYLAIPITHAGFSLEQVDAMADALENADSKVLAYCRSGTRSTLLWAMAQAKAGQPLDEITKAAESAGYNVSPVKGTMDMLAKGA